MMLQQVMSLSPSIGFVEVELGLASLSLGTVSFSIIDHDPIDTKAYILCSSWTHMRAAKLS
eukprot:4708584-Amphidinium_carterae.1